MKTAEEYISDIRLKSALVDAPVGWFDEGQIAKIMDKYAKQEAIEFTKWLFTNGQYSVGLNAGGLPYGKADGSFEYFATEELYKIWKDENNK